MPMTAAKTSIGGRVLALAGWGKLGGGIKKNARGGKSQRETGQRQALRFSKAG